MLWLRIYITFQYIPDPESWIWYLGPQTPKTFFLEPLFENRQPGSSKRPPRLAILNEDQFGLFLRFGKFSSNATASIIIENLKRGPRIWPGSKKLVSIPEIISFENLYIQKHTIKISRLGFQVSMAFWINLVFDFQKELTNINIHKYAN